MYVVVVLKISLKGATWSHPSQCPYLNTRFYKTLQKNPTPDSSSLWNSNSRMNMNLEYGALLQISMYKT